MGNLAINVGMVRPSRSDYRYANPRKWNPFGESAAIVLLALLCWFLLAA
jgi:hypothetical protein